MTIHVFYQISPEKLYLYLYIFSRGILNTVPNTVFLFVPFSLLPFVLSIFFQESICKTTFGNCSTLGPKMIAHESAGDNSTRINLQKKLSSFDCYNKCAPICTRK